MKTNKKRFANYLKLGILLFGISVLLWNCEKDEIISAPEKEKSLFVQNRITISQIPEIEKLLPTQFRGKYKGKTHTLNEAIFDEENILEVIDTLNFKNYSFRFTLPNSKIGEFYNLVIGKDTEGNLVTPFVLKYVCNDDAIEDYIKNDFNYDFFKGTTSLHKYTDYFEKGYFDRTGTNCPPKLDANGDPLPCKQIDVNNSGSGGNSSTGGSTGGSTTGSGSGPTSGGSGYDNNCYTIKFVSCSCGGKADGHGADKCGCGTGSPLALVNLCTGEIQEFYRSASKAKTNISNKVTDDCPECNLSSGGAIGINPLDINSLRTKLINDIRGLSNDQINWINHKDNTAAVLNIILFLNLNADLNGNWTDQKAINWTIGQIELGVLTKNIPWKASAGTIAGLKYTHVYFDSSRGYYKLEDGSIVVNSSSEQKLTSSGDLTDKYREFNPNDKFYYIKIAGTNEWAEMLFNPDNLADGLANLFKLGAIDLGKNLGRYVLPIEDIKIFIDGKNFDGQQVSRYQAAGFLLLSVIPGSKALKVVGNAADATVVAIKLAGSTLVVDTVKASLRVVTDNNTIRFLDSLGTEIAKIVNGVMTFNYRGFGGNIITNPNKTTTLIGKWDGQLENIWKTELVKHGQNIGGFNVLGNLPPNWSDLTIAQRWANNKVWLERAIARGDVIRVTANPLDISNVFHITTGVDPTKFSDINQLKNYLLSLNPTLVGRLSFYGREIRHLFQNDYIFDSTLNQFIK